MATASALVSTCILLSSCAFGASETRGSDIAAVNMEIEKRGVTQTVNRLFADEPEWAIVINQVGSGDPKWIDLALRMMDGADAGASTALRDALFGALTRNPEYVLRTAGSRLALVCGGRADPLPSYAEALSEIERAKQAIDSVMSGDLQAKKEQCLAKLGDARRHLERFFEKS